MSAIKGTAVAASRSNILHRRIKGCGRRSQQRLDDQQACRSAITQC